MLAPLRSSSETDFKSELNLPLLTALNKVLMRKTIRA